MIRSVLFFATLLSLAFPQVTHAQSSTRILKYNEKGEVTGVIEGKPSETKRSAPKGKTTVKETPQTRRPGADDEPAAEPGEIMIVNPSTAVERALRADGYRVLERIALEHLGITTLRLRTPDNLSAEAAVQAIEKRFPSLSVGVNQRFKVNKGPPGDYGRRVMGWGEVPPSCGGGIRIGMIDTLVDVNHPALKGQRVARRSFLPKGAKPGVSDHGTGVAGILVGKPASNNWKGLLPGAQLYAANIFAARPDGGLRANLASMMKALDWLAEKKVSVVNFSLSGSPNRVLKKLMQKASQRGLALVAAAGNGGIKARPAYPAAHPLVLAVTAVDQRLGIYDFANRGDCVDFAAPGVDLWTARDKGGGRQSGTSFAAPFITAAVALHLSAGTKPDAQTLRFKLRKFTKDLGNPGRDSVFGWGLVRIKPNC